MIAASILIGVAANILAAVAAYFASTRKGLSTSAWVVMTVLFSPLLFVLIFLPRKGEPTPRPWYGIPLEITGVAVLVLVFGTAIWSFALTQSLTGFPTCGSSLAQETAKHAFSQAPYGKRTGLTIIDLHDDREISATDTERHCTAIATINDGTEHNATYRIEKRNYQVFVFVQVLGLQ